MAKVIETSGVCWFCKKRNEDSESMVHKISTYDKKTTYMNGWYKHVKTQTFTRSWDIPRCNTCKKIHETSTIFAIFGILYPLLIILFGLISEEMFKFRIEGFWADVLFYSLWLSPIALFIWLLLPLVCGSKPKFTTNTIKEIYNFNRKGI